MAWGVNNSGWWGEGEIKFYMDGDKEFPTIIGAGTMGGGIQCGGDGRESGCRGTSDRM